MRQRHGFRNHVCTTWKHNGNRNDDGDPTYNVAEDWVPGEEWFAEVVPVAGGETLRGRQVTEQTRFVLYADYDSAMGDEVIRSADRITIDGDVSLEVISARDSHGDKREARIECGEEL